MKKIYMSCLFFVFLYGCAGTAPRAIPPQALPTQTLVPAATSVAGIVPTDALASSAATPDPLSNLIPHGEPAREWRGIPIMPGALAGDGDEEAYRFTTSAGKEEIQSFYARELSPLGWEMLGVGEGDQGALIMFFSRNDDSLSISIFPNQGTFLVLIV